MSDDDAIYVPYVKEAKSSFASLFGVERFTAIDSFISLLDALSFFKMHFTCYFNHRAAQLLRNAFQTRNQRLGAECWCEILSE